jgi:hypothetical protein
MPIEDNDIKRSIESARESLKKVAEEIARVKFPKANMIEFELSELSDKYINDKLKTVPAGYSKDLSETDFIYIFKLIDANEAKKDFISKRFNDSRSVQNTEDFEGKKDFCRWNEVMSDYLYIGRSQKLRSRLKQHLGAGNEGIFAMHMLRWATGVQCKVEISHYQFDKMDNLIIQALEDGLWQSFNPMFGRKGEK